MFAYGVFFLLTDKSFAWLVLICACTLVTKLTRRKNRPLIPALSASAWPSRGGLSEYFY
jgi:hypothetical protein